MGFQKLFINLNIGVKLAIGFALILVFLILTALIGFNALTNVNDRVDKGDDVNRLVKAMLQARRQEKNFTLRGDKSYLDKVEGYIEFLNTQTLETKEKFKKKENKDEMDRVLEAVDEYSKSFHAFVDMEDKKNQTMTEMRAKASTVISILENIRDTHKSYSADVNHLIQWFLNVRKNEKEYIISRGEQEWKDNHDDFMLQVKNLTYDLRSKSKQSGKIRQIDELISAINGYEAAFYLFVDYMKQQESADQNMVNAARKTEKICNDSRVNQKTKMLASMSSSINLILIFSILAIIIGVLFAFLITRSITKPLNTTVGLAEKISVGEMNIDIIETDRKDEVGKLLQVFYKMSNYLIKMSEIAISISKGDMTIEVKPLSDKDTLGNAFKTMAISLNEKAGLAEEIANGNLSIEVKPLSDKDTLGNAFKTMVEKNRYQINEIREGINVLASSASEIMAAVSQLASSAAETATSVGETTTTVEEVKQTAEVSNEKATGVSENSQKTMEISQGGTKAIKDALEGMNRIKQQMESIADIVVKLSEQSQTIGEINSTVNDLAEQSNLLSVNASIEAAKAGEHGKGFAVVAQEIKNLAERSKEANTQIRGILSDIQKSVSSAVMATEEGGKTVDEGLKLSTTAGEAIDVLSESITEAAQATIQIAASSQQQLVGMDQIVTAMESIKEASVQTAASTKQSETSVTELHKLGEKLQELLKQYKIS